MIFFYNPIKMLQKKHFFFHFACLLHDMRFRELPIIIYVKNIFCCCLLCLMLKMEKESLFFTCQCRDKMRTLRII